MKRILAQLLWLPATVLAGAVFLSGAWGALALWYQLPARRAVRAFACALWMLLVAGLIALAVLIWRPWPLLAYAVLLAALLAWWAGIRPTHRRCWAPDVDRLLHGSVDGDVVTLRNVRNFDWHRDDDFDVRWETRHYDLAALVGADAILSYWNGRAIAHAMVSFGFDDGRHLVFSVEIRKRRGQAYSSLGGFFKCFEMIVLAAEERDIVRVRTNVRGEDDYLYPLSMDRAALRALFASYVEAANALCATPRFYHSVSSNCTTLVYRMARQAHPGLPLDIRLLLTGYLPGYLREHGVLDPRFTLRQWRQRARITGRARRCPADGDFSRAIREPASP